MRPLLIFGFPHSGTSILKSLIGNCANVCEYPFEAFDIKIASELPCSLTSRLLIKWPYARPEFFGLDYAGYDKIFVMRSPFFCFSSINKKFNYKPLPVGHRIKDWDWTAEMFLRYRELRRSDLFFIKYEDFFDAGFGNLKRLFNALGLEYTDAIFRNDGNDNVINRKIVKAKTSGVALTMQDIHSVPSPIQHDRYRTWQINQPFTNMNDPQKIALTDAQRTTLLGLTTTARLGYKMP